MAKVIGPTDGKQGWLAAIGVRFMVDGDETGGGFSLVEHPMPPRALAAPLHRHLREDEYSYVLRGRVGAQLGDEIVYAQAGDLVFKPRGEWHTFWNAGDEDASILEIISPAGFERYFEEVIALPKELALEERLPLIAGIAARYELELDFSSVPGLLERHGLVSTPPALDVMS